MPILTGTILTRSPSKMKTTSIGLGAFLSNFAVLVPSLVRALVLAARLLELVASSLAFVLIALEFVAGGSFKAASFSVSFFFASAFFSLGRRVVTLAIGTVNTFDR